MKGPNPEVVVRQTNPVVASYDGLMNGEDRLALHLKPGHLCSDSQFYAINQLFKQSIVMLQLFVTALSVSSLENIILSQTCLH